MRKKVVKMSPRINREGSWNGNRTQNWPRLVAGPGCRGAAGNGQRAAGLRASGRAGRPLGGQEWQAVLAAQVLLCPVFKGENRHLIYNIHSSGT